MTEVVNDDIAEVVMTEEYEEMDKQLFCPTCKSTNWYCWDERLHYWEDTEGNIYEHPVGYLACDDCKHSWCDIPDLEGCIYFGDGEEIWGDDDEW